MVVITRPKKESKPLSLLYRLLISALSGLLTYGILWSAYFQVYQLLMVVAGFIPIMALIWMAKSP